MQSMGKDQKHQAQGWMNKADHRDCDNCNHKIWAVSDDAHKLQK